MFRRVVPRAAAALAAAMGLGLSAPSHASVQIVSQFCRVDHARREAVFSILLDGPFDFDTIDAFDRHRDSFQYEINTNWSGLSHVPRLETFNFVVRGDELGATGMLPVRSADYVDPDPNPLSSGWGDMVATIPLTMEDNRLSFRIPLNLLGEFDDVFAYRVFTTEFGATVSSDDGRVVPLPNSAPATGVAVAVLYAGNAARKRLRPNSRSGQNERG